MRSNALRVTNLAVDIQRTQMTNEDQMMMRVLAHKSDAVDSQRQDPRCCLFQFLLAQFFNILGERNCDKKHQFGVER